MRLIKNGRTGMEIRFVDMDWEYKIIDTAKDGNCNEFELNELGSEGWELCSVLSMPIKEWASTFYRFYFKRPINYTERGNHKCKFCSHLAVCVCDN